ncbi:MAG: hypothetical protein KatS3mg105_2099 [Gemmatales bacterium]|nr:MAG: hypothetical protein KatS3mg105_2099 [Gemmatales bacterium]
MAKKQSYCEGQRQGVAAVELAVLLPLILMLLVGVWEIGRAVHVQQIVANSAREGARQAAAGVFTASQVQANVLAMLQSSGLDASNASVTVENLTSGKDPAVADQLDHLRVTVSLPFTDVKWVILNMFVSDSTQLVASTDWRSMRDIPLTVPNEIPIE